MNEVIRYEAVHLRYEESDIRYGEGCEVEVVTARAYDELEKKCKKQIDRFRKLIDEITDDYVINHLDSELVKRIDAALIEEP